ncbi:MAG: diguanylate cyclase domain-containing protein [Gammaproteobacteria bacterium]
MKLRLSLADKISIAIILIGIFCIMLVYYISDSYKHFAYEHHGHSIQQLATVEVDDLIEILKSNSLDLALAIEHENDFLTDFRFNRTDALTQQLNNQFNQYFVTAGVIRVLKLYVLDTDFTLRSVSTEGISTDLDGELICPQLSQSAVNRKGAGQLQTLSRSCLYRNLPVFAVIVPFGGLNPKGYIQVVTDLAYSLQKIEQSLAMPIQINTIDDQLLYQSKDWLTTPDNNNHIHVDLPIFSDDDTPIMTISIKSDMTTFNKEIIAHRNRVMTLTFVATGLTVFFVLLILRRSTIPILAKIHDVLERIHSNSKINSKDSRLLFAQLLDQIILLRRRSGSHFSVMILDLTHFKKVNDEYGEETGDRLLIEVEQRLSSVLRGSDLISWIGTDTSGHKLLPSGTKTQYRATLARLGGDEFGLLLPSAETAEQSSAVAIRIVDALNKPFQIDGHDINIECKVGISIYPTHGEDENLLIRNADKAMYQAKALNQDVFVFNTEL